MKKQRSKGIFFDRNFKSTSNNYYINNYNEKQTHNSNYIKKIIWNMYIFCYFCHTFYFISVWLILSVNGMLLFAARRVLPFGIFNKTCNKVYIGQTERTTE